MLNKKQLIYVFIINISFYEINAIMFANKVTVCYGFRLLYSSNGAFY